MIWRENPEGWCGSYVSFRQYFLDFSQLLNSLDTHLKDFIIHTFNTDWRPGDIALFSQMEKSNHECKHSTAVFKKW